MDKENCALKLVDEIILYCYARSKKHKKNIKLDIACVVCFIMLSIIKIIIRFEYYSHFFVDFFLCFCMFSFVICVVINSF